MSRASGAGSFGNGPNLYNQTRSEFDEDARRSLVGLGPSKPKLTAAQVKEAFEEAQREDQKQQDQAVSIENGKAFLAGHPEWINSEANIQLMNHELVSRFGVRAYTILDYEEAYASLRSSNFLNVNKTVLAAQEKQAAKERYDAAKARRAERTFNPNASYENLTLEQLRDRANEELQLAGEQEGASGF